MLFHTTEFALLFALVACGLWVVRSWKQENWLLLVASYAFYGWWDVRFLPLLAFSTLSDFWIAKRLERSDARASRRGLLGLSLAVNLGLLAFFKYAGLFTSTALGLGSVFGLEVEGLEPLRVALPVGISFYTFQTLGYTIDVYRRSTPACHSLRDFALYVSFFPQLVAGPIERASRLFPQLRGERSRRLADLEAGLFLFASGWLRKAVGDVLGSVADPAFANPSEATPWALLWGLYAFAFQIYCDFSGYTDMARGIARAMGIELMENFRAPYFSRNVKEFWSRWHISLSTWLRDYLYIPLGGNRGSSWKVRRNLMATMLLGGLWHGAAWNFVVWGGLHGLYLGLHRAWTKRRDASSPVHAGWPLRVASAFVTFHLVLLTWLAFRVRPVGETSTWQVTVDYLHGLSNLSFQPFEAPPVAFWTVGLVLLQDALLERRGSALWHATWPSWARGALVGAGILAAFVLASGSNEAFLYFQF